MEKKEHPLVIEYHDEFEDIYIKARSPFHVARYEIYGLIIVILAVFATQAVEGETQLEIYLGLLLLLIILFGLYKAFKVGMDSIGFRIYKESYFTRVADDFVIWYRDPPLPIADDMTVRIREVGSSGEGVIYLYHGGIRSIVFMADDNTSLQLVANHISKKFDLEQEPFQPEN